MAGQEAVCILMGSRGTQVTASTPNITANRQFQQPQSGLVPEQEWTLMEGLMDPLRQVTQISTCPGGGDAADGGGEYRRKRQSPLNWRWELPLVFGH